MGSEPARWLNNVVPAKIRAGLLNGVAGSTKDVNKHTINSSDILKSLVPFRFIITGVRALAHLI